MRRPHLLLLFFPALPMSPVVFGSEVIKGSYEKGVTLALTVDVFDAKSHIIKKCGDYVCLIDGKPFYGTDGKIPTHVVSSLIYEKQGKRIALDVSSMYDPIVSSESMKWAFSVNSGDYIGGGNSSTITGYFSDGAGAYVCQWRVALDGAIRNHISNYEELSELFSQVDKR